MTGESERSVEPTPDVRPERGELRYLALGDSYTIGESVDVSERWPVQLVRRLQDASVSIAEPEIIARTGWTTSELANAIELAAPQGPFDLVTLSIGVNNQFRGLDIDQYRIEFAALLQWSVRLAGDRPTQVIVVSIPDYSVTPFGIQFGRDRIAQEIDLYNMINEEETGQVGATYIDITGVSRRADTEPDLVAPDGLHPSGEMYRRWVDLILPAALEITTGEK